MSTTPTPYSYVEPVDLAVDRVPDAVPSYNLQALRRALAAAAGQAGRCGLAGLADDLAGHTATVDAALAAREADELVELLDEVGASPAVLIDLPALAAQQRVGGR